MTIHSCSLLEDSPMVGVQCAMVAPTWNVKNRISCSENDSSENNIVGKIDNQRILETLAKLEKQRERFKDSIAPKQEPEDKNPKPQAYLLVDTAETKQQRPGQKRRWGGS